MKPHILERITIINRPILEVFDFFSKAENLDTITPDSLSFKIVTPLPIHMKEGTLIYYKLRFMGIPFTWRTLISTWAPPHKFVDEQIKGPYVKWHHTHTFKDLGNNTTQMEDRVEFLSPGWIMEPIINYLFIKSKVEQIFNHRTEKLKEIFK